MPNIDLSILNQRQTPAIYASSLATRPAFGFLGRVFIDTDSPSTGIYRDTGTSWIQIADPGAGTTGTLQQVTTNGKTTNQGITITAGGLSSNLITIDANALSSSGNSILQGMGNTDFWKIYGFATTSDQAEMIFQVGDNASPYASGGERFRFNYDNSGGGTGAKDVFIVDYDLSYFNTSLGINTPTPTSALDVHSGVNVISQLNQTTATNNSLLAFQNSGSGLWRIGNFYNSGANDFGIFDVIGANEQLTIKKTTGQTFIGAQTTTSGRLVVNNATGDNHIVVIGATAPSLRINNSGSGATKQIGIGLATASNNFIQGAVDRDMTIFNGCTTASPILFGIYDTTNIQEAARISAARNFIVGKTTDSGQRLQISGTALINGATTISTSVSGGQNLLINTTVAAGRNYIQWTNGSGDMGYIGFGGADSKFYINNQLNDDMIFLTNGIERMRILNSGNVGFGSNTPNAKVYAIGNSTTQEIFYAEKSTASFTGNVITSLTYTASGTGWNHFVGYSDIGGVTNIKILGNGNIQNANNSYGAISDFKLKENIVDTSDKLNDLLKVKIRNFNLIGQQMKQIGVIAQELETIFPNLIEETNDIDKNGLNLGTTTKSVKYSVFIPILIKAIQELNTKIENLK